MKFEASEDCKNRKKKFLLSDHESFDNSVNNMEQFKRAYDMEMQRIRSKRMWASIALIITISVLSAFGVFGGADWIIDLIIYTLP